MKKHNLKTMISEEEVEARIKELAQQITQDYTGKTLHMVGILKGSVPFMWTLARYIKLPLTMDFISCSSYGSGTTSSGVVRFNKDLDEAIEGKDVLLVEDIIDTGRTLSYLVPMLEQRRPNSLKLASLLDKPSRRVCPEVQADYCGFQIPDQFVVGYGLDYDQCYRNLPYIGYIEILEG